MRQMICLFTLEKSPVYGVFGQQTPHPAANDRNRKRTWAVGLAFPPRNLSKKFNPDPSTFYLVIVVTVRQTNVRR